MCILKFFQVLEQGLLRSDVFSQVSLGHWRLEVEEVFTPSSHLVECYDVHRVGMATLRGGLGRHTEPYGQVSHAVDHHTLGRGLARSRRGQQEK